MRSGSLVEPLVSSGRGARVSAARALVDLVLPPQCISCGRRVGAYRSLCPGCWSKLRLIERPYCEKLGTPFAYDLGEGAVSAEAIADPPPFGRCRAVAAFDDVSKSLVHGLKYRDRLDLSASMANWMVRAGADLLADADLVVPVPLHRWRLWSRRFNQSASLARHVAEAAGKPFAGGALRRVRPTRQQVGLSATERDRNVRGAFKVAENDRFMIESRSLLLVDDVYTTGATVKAAVRALLRGGAKSVDVLVFARVVRDAG
jgi:ComF family protein